MLGAILLLSVCFVAFTNGANANFKGVASLYGSGTTSLRTALWWGTATTFCGSVAAIFMAHGLLKKFGGLEIVPSSVAQSPEFAASVGLGAALTSFLATRFGFPVSTTHALVGALVGAGLAGSGANIEWIAVARRFVIPLCTSPLVAAALGAALYGVLRLAKLAPDHRTKTLDACHFVSCGAASFARGLNDSPKMAALLLVSPTFSVNGALAIVAVLIAVGGLLDSQQVAETLGKKVTHMNPGQGFAASLVTAGLVATASLHSQPVSTTHVSVGSLVGIGAVTHQAKWRKAWEVLAAWITTVPCGAIFAAIAYAVISQLTIAPR